MKKLMTASEVLNNFDLPFKNSTSLYTSQLFKDAQIKTGGRYLLKTDVISKYLEERNKEVILYNNINYKKIKNTNNYFISECGKVLSTASQTIFIKKLTVDRDGYFRVSIKFDDGVTKIIGLSRLLYETYIGELKENMEIDHIDSNNKNNNLNNLRQVSHADNVKFQHKNLKGNYKLSIAQVLEIRDSPLSATELSKMYNVCYQQINNIKFKRSFAAI